MKAHRHAHHRVGRPYQCSLVLALGFCLGSHPVRSHEFWMEPERFITRIDQALAIDLRNGEQLAGDTLPFLPDRLSRFEIIDGLGREPVAARPGDLPAATISPRTAGLLTVVYQSEPSLLVYPDWARFERFAREEDVRWVLEEHQAKGFPADHVTERFRRFGKLLVWVEPSGPPVAPTLENHAWPTEVDLQLEILLLNNPYRLTQGGAIRVQLTFDGEPLGDTQLSVFHKRPDGKVTVDRQRVDRNGRLDLIPETQGWYLLSAVVVEQSAASVMLATGALWESLWASTTFAVQSISH